MSGNKDIVSCLNGLLGLPSDIDQFMGTAGTINVRDNNVLAMEVCRHTKSSLAISKGTD